MDCDKIVPVRHCDCTIPEGGWCEPHQVMKTKHWVELCQTKWKYRDMWNMCRGPGQRLGDKPKEERFKQPVGPGAELRRSLGCGGSRTSKCDFRQMDRWGIQGCREHLDEIVQSLVNPKMDIHAATRMAQIAIDRAAKKLQQLEESEDGN